MTVKDYVSQEKEKLKALNIEFKLGVVGNDAVKQEVEELGWEFAACGNVASHDAVISAVNEGCTGIAVGPQFDFDPYIIPRRLDCGGVRPDSLVAPGLARGVVDYLRARDFQFSGKTAVVVGHGAGDLPLARLLLQEGMTVCLCGDWSDESVVSGFLCDADLVICSSGSIVRTQCLNAVVVDCEGRFEEKPRLCSEKVWSISAEEVDALTILGLLKNCAILMEGKAI